MQVKRITIPSNSQLFYLHSRSLTTLFNICFFFLLLFSVVVSLLIFQGNISIDLCKCNFPSTNNLSIQRTGTEFSLNESNKHDSRYRVQFQPQKSIPLNSVCACVLIGIVRTLRFHTGGIRLFFLYFFRFSIFDLSIETEVSLLGFVLRGVWFLQSTKRYILIHLIKGKMQTAFEICSRSLLIYVCSNLRVLCSAQRTKWNENTNKFVLGKYDTGNASNSLHENINKRNFL